MRIVFMGTPDFSVGCLEALLNSEHEVVGVFCQPDKPVGRSQTLTAPPVKELAVKAGLEVFQPVSLKDGKGLEIISQLEPDVIIVVAYGKILPKDVLDYPKYGCINIHASILPMYRGASPIQWSVINGDKVTGVTAQQMDEGVDTGDILMCEKTEIGINETAGELFDRLAVLGAEVLMKTMEKLVNGELNPVKQEHEKATHVGLLSKKDSPIDWSLSAFEVHNKIRGLNPWPSASTTLGGKTLKVHESRLTGEKRSGESGSIIAKNGKMLVCCGDGEVLEITSIQPEGKKRMPAASFLNGRSIAEGEKFI